MVNRINSFGLVEVLVAIAIMGVILTGSVSVASRSLIMVRENEMQDISNGILLRSLEISRSPEDIKLGILQAESDTKSYFITKIDGKYVLQVSNSQEPINNCSNASEFYVALPDENLLFCNQAIVKDISRNSQTIFRDFEIKSTVVYEYLGVKKFVELISFRSEPR